MSDAQNPYRAPQSSASGPTDQHAHWPIVIEGIVPRRDAVRAMQMAMPKTRLAILLAIMAIIMPLAYAGAPDYGVHVWIVFALMMAAIFIVLIVVAPRARVNAIYRRGVAMAAPHRREISPRGIITITPTLRAEQAWEGITRCKVGDRVVLLYGESGMAFSAIARAQFADAVDWQRFIELVENKVPGLK